MESARMNKEGIFIYPPLEYNPDITSDPSTPPYRPVPTGSTVMPLLYNMHRTHTHSRIT